MELTKRQIEILTGVGLSAVEGELTAGQRKDIRDIENMLCYLDETYHTNATYVHYEREQILSPAVLTAEVNGVEVTVTGKYINEEYFYQDNYEELCATATYEAEIQAYFLEKGLEGKVFAQIEALEGEAEDILAKARASTYVFLCAEMTRQELQQLAVQYGAWYAARLNGVANSTRLYVLSRSNYLDVGLETYWECAQEVAKDSRMICVISSDGSVTTV